MSGIQLLPERASEFAQRVDLLFLFLTTVTVFFTLLIAALVVFFALKYRKGSNASRAGAKDTDLRLEIVWSLIPLSLGLFTFVWASKLYGEVYGPPPENALEIFVIGKQWMWHMQHPNGIRENNQLHIPAGRPVKLTMISQDVIHSFYVPAFRIKRDVLPGTYSTVWFTPTKPGKYHLFCAEYCGTQHSRMVGTVYVLEPAEYERWLASGGEMRVGEAASGAGTTAGVATASLVQAGEKLYNQLRCNACHGLKDDPRGPTHYGLFGKKVKLRDGTTVVADEAYIRESIVRPTAKVVDGYEPIMPSYEGLLSEERVLQLVAYIKSLEKPEKQVAEVKP
ncbi:MAG: cytochrome c oxidase subunit II [Firmicutes bacterium]|nr:cytochrome c oxidase subunit II [Bacillota bacterium]